MDAATQQLVQLGLGSVGSIALGWLSHALYIKPQQLAVNHKQTALGNAVASVENQVIAPLATGTVQQLLGNLANPQTATPLPPASQYGQAITAAALTAITHALTGPHTAAPLSAGSVAAPAASVNRSVAAPVVSSTVSAPVPSDAYAIGDVTGPADAEPIASTNL